MKIFLEAKFTRGTVDNDLISIGAVSEDNREFYAELNDFDEDKVAHGIRDFVVNHLVYKKPPQGEQEHYLTTRWENNPVGRDIYEGYSVTIRGNLFVVMEELNRWLSQFKNENKIREDEIWVDMYDDDYGSYSKLAIRFFPDNVHRFPFDIRTYMNIKGLPLGTTVRDFVKDRPQGNEWLAIYDARLIKLCYEELKTVLPHYKGEK